MLRCARRFSRWKWRSPTTIPTIALRTCSPMSSARRNRLPLPCPRSRRCGGADARGMDVTLDVPGLDEPATGRLISIPERRAPMLNDLFLREGRYIEPGQRGEVLVSEAFAMANRLGRGRLDQRGVEWQMGAAAHCRHRAFARIYLRNPAVGGLPRQSPLRCALDEP